MERKKIEPGNRLFFPCEISAERVSLFLSGPRDAVFHGSLYPYSLSLSPTSVRFYQPQLFLHVCRPALTASLTAILFLVNQVIKRFGFPRQALRRPHSHIKLRSKYCGILFRICIECAILFVS